jgi:hypothetical protein
MKRTFSVLLAIALTSVGTGVSAKPVEGASCHAVNAKGDKVNAGKYKKEKDGTMMCRNAFQAISCDNKANTCTDGSS